MHCPVCGAANEGSANRCETCGSLLTGSLARRLAVSQALEAEAPALVPPILSSASSLDEADQETAAGAPYALCPECYVDNPPDARRCRACGRQLQAAPAVDDPVPAASTTEAGEETLSRLVQRLGDTCGRCGRSNVPDARYCAFCGHGLAAEGAARQSGDPAEDSATSAVVIEELAPVTSNGHHDSHVQAREYTPVAFDAAPPANPFPSIPRAEPSASTREAEPMPEGVTPADGWPAAPPPTALGSQPGPEASVPAPNALSGFATPPALSPVVGDQLTTAMPLLGSHPVGDLDDLLDDLFADPPPAPANPPMDFLSDVVTGPPSVEMKKEAGATSETMPSVSSAPMSGAQAVGLMPSEPGDALDSLLADDDAWFCPRCRALLSSPGAACARCAVAAMRGATAASPPRV